MDEARLPPHDTRRRVFEAVHRFPGLGAAQLGRLTGESASLVDYHLDALDAAGLVVLVKDESVRRASGARLARRLGEKRLLMLGLMREKVPFQVLLVALGQATPVHHGELAESVQVAKSTLTYHLDKLVARGILLRIAKGPGKGYRVAEREVVHALFCDHLPTPEMMDTYGSLWLDLYRRPL
ncbi:MAG: helix-turn-helix domain-containing protein [Euryarchaeota archaeon]|nr:helix-turn-helix domain-containing protein [Euryarchaeota archaeon]